MLEFVSVLRRLVGGDTKDVPTADDKVLIVDAADGDKIKEARVGDLPGPPPLSEHLPPPTVFWPVLLTFSVPYYGVDEFGTLKLAFQYDSRYPGPHRTVGYYLVGGGDPEQPCPVRIPPQIRDIVLVNATPRNIVVDAADGPGPLVPYEDRPRHFRMVTADAGSPNDSFFTLGPRSAARFLSTDDSEAIFVVFPLT